MRNQSQELLTRVDDRGRWERAKYSDLIVEFAEPLMYADPQGPSNIGELKNIISLAMLCWNAPMAEVKGDRSLMGILEPALKTAPAPIASALRQMLSARMTRYAGVPHTIVAEVTGSSLDDARCVAHAFASEPTSMHPKRSGGPMPITPTSIIPLASLFPELAAQEEEVWKVSADESAALQLPTGTYVLRERYCADPGCDCRRVMLYVEHVEGQRVIATIGYGFEPPEPRYSHFERQIELDWLNPQSEHSDAALRKFERQIAADPALRARLVDHYAQWKKAVDDRQHPLHARLVQLRGTQGISAVRSGPKVGVNARCPCGSGRKYKRCCMSSQRKSG
jgi:hypothetical protein